MTLAASRTIADLSDTHAISGVLNSILAQEAGQDYGDYALVDRAGFAFGYPLSAVTGLSLEADYEDASAVRVEASPAHGHYRPNPALGAGSHVVGRVAIARNPEQLSPSPVARRHLALTEGRIALEAGAGDTDYLRGTISGTVATPLGPGDLRLKALGGWGTRGLPAYRSFVLGGRGTLLGEPFRRFGGRSYGLARLEWEVPVPFVAIPLGSFVSTGSTMRLAPFVAVGWTDRALGGTPWRESDGLRPVAGLAADLFMRLVRVEAGVGLRTGSVGVTVDFGPAWWGIL